MLIPLTLVLLLDNPVYREFPIYSLNISAGFENDHFFRGVLRNAEEEAGVVFFEYIDFSTYGFSGGWWHGHSPNGNYQEDELFLSFSYALDFADVTLGLNYISLGDSIGDLNEKHHEFFLEARGVPWKGFLPGFSLFRKLNDTGQTYFEFQVARDLFLFKENRFKPHLSLGWGDYQSDSFESTHLELGWNSAFLLAKRLDVGFYGTLIMPFGQMRPPTGSSFYGTVGFRFRFNPSLE